MKRGRGIKREGEFRRRRGEGGASDRTWQSEGEREGKGKGEGAMER
jgi:hypothetical protein